MLIVGNHPLLPKVDYWQLDRRRCNGLELFHAVDHKTFDVAIIDLAEIEFRLGMRTGTRRQIGLEKSRYVRGGCDGRSADIFGFFRVVACDKPTQ